MQSLKTWDCSDIPNWQFENEELVLIHHQLIEVHGASNQESRFLEERYMNTYISQQCMYTITIF